MSVFFRKENDRLCRRRRRRWEGAIGGVPRHNYEHRLDQPSKRNVTAVTHAAMITATVRRLTALSLIACLLAAPGASAARALQNDRPCDGESVPKTGHCKQWCKQHPKKDFCAPLWEDICPSHPGKDFCQPWLKTHCEGETHKEECQKYCKQHPNKDVCKPNCIHNGGNPAFFTSSAGAPADGAGQVDQVTLTNTFNSFQDKSLPPGQVATKNLPDLLSALGLDLSKKQIKQAKRELDPNNTGSFSLFKFLMWWARYVVCTSISG